MKIVSWNARGLTKEKWFGLLKGIGGRVDVVMIQETNCGRERANEMEWVLKKEWRVEWGLAVGKARGVMVAMRKERVEGWEKLRADERIVGVRVKEKGGKVRQW